MTGYYIQRCVFMIVGGVAAAYFWWWWLISSSGDGVGQVARFDSFSAWVNHPYLVLKSGLLFVVLGASLAYLLAGKKPDGDSKGQ